MKILLSGGHLTPALAFIEYIQQNHPEVELYFAGRVYSRKEEKQLSREREEMQARGVTFISFSSGKLGQGNAVSLLRNSLRMLRGFGQALLIFPRYKPDVFVSFGGYLAVPLAVAAWFWRIPVITHEQTRTAGIANNLIAPFAKKIALSYQETKEFFSASKTVITGNLIRQEILKEIKEPPPWFKYQEKKPLLYITGGSQGSEVINATVARSLNVILKDWVVIHQCGSPTKRRNYEKELQRERAQLTKAKQERYYIKPWINEQDLAWIYTKATAVISRAGANTTHELQVRRVPAILIPLPFSHNDEQYLNAKALADTGGAILLPQKDLTSEKLIEALELIKKQPMSFRRKLAKADDYKENAAESLFKLAAEAANYKPT